MSDEEGFLEAIRQNLDDDVPRLIFADWLEERDDPRADFIRVQCELARGVFTERLEELRRRQAQLLDKHRDAWLGPLQEVPTLPRFMRGFVTWAGLPAQLFVQHSEAIFRCAPLLLDLYLIQVRPHTAAIAGCPLIERLRTLKLRGPFPDLRSVEPLLTSPYLVRLERLRIESICVMNREAVRALRSRFGKRLAF